MKKVLVQKPAGKLITKTLVKKKINPAKTNLIIGAANPKLHIPLTRGKLPLYQQANEGYVGKEYMLAFDNTQGKVNRFIARQADLPKIMSNDREIGYQSLTSQLDSLLDIFKPDAGYQPFSTTPRFFFIFSALSYTNTNSWNFDGDHSSGWETLKFYFWENRNEWFYIKCNFHWANCILTLRIGDVSTQLNLQAHNNDDGSFGFFVKIPENSSYSPDIDFIVNRNIQEDPGYRLSIRSIELYRTIRIPNPGPVTL